MNYTKELMITMVQWKQSDMLIIISLFSKSKNAQHKFNMRIINKISVSDSVILLKNAALPNTSQSQQQYISSVAKRSILVAEIWMKDLSLKEEAWCN